VVNTKLSVLATASAMVPDYRQQAGGRKAFVGWTFDSTLGDGVSTSGGFVRSESPVEVVAHSVDVLNQYKQHVLDGDLLAADDATAALCGVPKPAKAATSGVKSAWGKGADHE